MKPQFLQVGRYHINLNAIGYIVTVQGGINVITTVLKENGKRFWIPLRGADAEKLLNWLAPMTVRIAKPGEIPPLPTR